MSWEVGILWLLVRGRKRERDAGSRLEVEKKGGGKCQSMRVGALKGGEPPRQVVAGGRGPGIARPDFRKRQKAAIRDRRGGESSGEMAGLSHREAVKKKKHQQEGEKKSCPFPPREQGLPAEMDPRVHEKCPEEFVGPDRKARPWAVRPAGQSDEESSGRGRRGGKGRGGNFFRGAGQIRDPQEEGRG